MLAVDDPASAIAFYIRAFGAELVWQIGEPAGVAGMRIEGADFFLARANPPSTSAPGAAGTTVRIELFVDDPHATQARAVAAGAIDANTVQERTHQTSGTRTQLRMLQGGVIDPFGHVWLIGMFLD
jgi:uncharacterized glyoxalase superfamily protein PhnB